MFYIYVIQNTVNNKIYVGKSNKPEERWLRHLIVAKGGKKKYPTHFQYLHASISKYSAINFIFQVLEEFKNENDCFEFEKFWIEFFRSWDPKFGYNLTNGGEGSCGRIISEITKNKIRNKAIGRKAAPETKNKLSEIGKSRVNSIETRNRISKSNKGRKLTEEQKVANSQRQMGEKSPSSKLTNEQAKEIRLLASTIKRKELAKMYNVSKSTIALIIQRRTYKD